MKPDEDEHRTRCRLDCPITGRVVYLLGSAGDGYSRVKSKGLRIRFETKTERLHPQ